MPIRSFFCPSLSTPLYKYVSEIAISPSIRAFKKLTTNSQNLAPQKFSIFEKTKPTNEEITRRNFLLDHTIFYTLGAI